MTSVTPDSLRAEVESLFTPRAGGSCGSLAVGAELELIPVDIADHRIVPAMDGDGRGTARAIRRVAAGNTWSEVSGDGDPPSWSLGDGWRLSYEPGGQLEISSAPCTSASLLVTRMQSVVDQLGNEFARESITLLSLGVDPCNHISDVPLQLHRDRYTRMTEYFERRHTSGVRMMRQSASLQINVEIGPDPKRRWTLLNALTPYVTAMFANSPLYRGVSTGHRSYRAFLWRTLDPSRTGLPFDATDPAGAYLDFALDAGAMMHNGNNREGSFRDWYNAGSATIEDWRCHLSTLFPEVRPRSWFEVRSVDAIDPAWIVAPIATVCGIAYSPLAAERAAAMLGKPDEALLAIAGQYGLADDRIAETSIALAELSLVGIEELGDAFMTGGERDRVREYYDRYTFRRRAPADDRD